MDRPAGTAVDVARPAPRDTAAARAAPAPRRWLTAAGLTLAAGAAFAVYLRLASSRAVNSDGASVALLGWDMLRGNVLLHGWKLADVSFCTTEVPQYALLDLVRGLSPDVIHLAAAMTYTLVVLFAALLAKGAATGREAALRVGLTVGILLAPQLDAGTDLLLSSPDHTGTAVPVMAAWLVLDRCRPHWRVPAAVAALLAWAQLGDTLALIAGVLPLVAVGAFRVLRGRLAGRRTGFDLALGAAGVTAAAAAVAAQRLITAAGGFTSRPLATGFAAPAHIAGHNLAVAGQGLLLLPGADFPGLPLAAPATWFVLLHLAGAALAAAGAGAAARRFRRTQDLVSQLLLAGIAANLAAYTLGTHAALVANAREMAPVLPFAAALAGRHLARPLLAAPPRARRALLTALAVTGAGYLAGLGLELTRPPAPPLAAPLTAWLERHPGPGTGLSGFWESNVVAVTSGNRAAVHLVLVSGGRLVPGGGQVKTAWYDPSRAAAHFVVLAPGIPGAPGLPGYPGFTDRAAVTAAFGAPARVYHAGRYTILWWPKNLVADLAKPSGIVRYS